MLRSRFSIVRSVAIGAGLIVFAQSALAAPPGTSFTYQGLLTDGGGAVTTAVDVRFTLWDDPVAGTQVAGPVTVTVTPDAGVFSASVDFGVTPFETNQQHYLEVEVSPQGAGTFDNLGRQALEAAPYALNTRGLFVSATNLVSLENTLSINAPGDVWVAMPDWDIGGNTGRLDFSENNVATHLTIVDGGNVGIGTLTPESALHVQGIRINDPTTPGVHVGSSNGISRYGLEVVSDASISSVIDFHQGTTQGDYGARINYDGTTDSLSLLDSNVGIGTATPEWALDVRGSNNPTINLKDTDEAQGIRMTTGPNAALRIATTDGVPLNIMELDYNANVGIGTTSPQTKLEVVDSTTAIRGHSTSTTGVNFGVYGQSDSASGWGVFANGRIGASGTKSFMIDHPLDPAGHILLHYSTETPEPQNRYNGNVILNGAGIGVVQLPDYFGAINANYRYILTAIGGPAPNLHIAQEVQANRFVIAGGQPGQKISWEVTAARADAFVVQRGAPEVLQKSGDSNGKYIMPELYGQPAEMGMHFVPSASLEGRAPAMHR